KRGYSPMTGRDGSEIAQRRRPPCSAAIGSPGAALELSIDGIQPRRSAAPVDSSARSCDRLVGAGACIRVCSLINKETEHENSTHRGGCDHCGYGLRVVVSISAPH